MPQAVSIPLLSACFLLGDFTGLFRDPPASPHPLFAGFIAGYLGYDLQATTPTSSTTRRRPSGKAATRA